MNSLLVPSPHLPHAQVTRESIGVRVLPASCCCCFRVACTRAQVMRLSSTCTGCGLWRSSTVRFTKRSRLVRPVSCLLGFGSRLLLRCTIHMDYVTLSRSLTWPLQPSGFSFGRLRAPRRIIWIMDALLIPPSYANQFCTLCLAAVFVVVAVCVAWPLQLNLGVPMPFSGCRVALIIYRMLCVSLFLHLCSSCFVSYVLILAPHYFQNACLCSHGSCEDEPWCSHMMCRLIANRCWLIIYWMLFEFWLIADWLLAACFIIHCSASVDWLLIDSLLIKWLLPECCLSASLIVDSLTFVCFAERFLSGVWYYVALCSTILTAVQYWLPLWARNTCMGGGPNHCTVRVTCTLSYAVCVYVDSCEGESTTCVCAFV